MAEGTIDPVIGRRGLIVGTHTDGRPIYQRKDGSRFVDSDDLPEVMKKGASEKDMADEVTKLDLLKRDIEQRDKEIGNKVQGVEKVAEGLGNKVKDVEKVVGEVDTVVKDVERAAGELGGKYRDLDSRVCKGEECYTRIEKKQDEAFKDIQERLKALSEPRFVCKKCHASSIIKGDKVCPVCGDPINVVWS